MYSLKNFLYLVGFLLFDNNFYYRSFAVLLLFSVFLLYMDRPMWFGSTKRFSD